MEVPTEAKPKPAHEAGPLVAKAIDEVIKTIHGVQEDIRAVMASSQYMMQFILVSEGAQRNGILYRDDKLTYAELKIVASTVNQLLLLERHEFPR